jgi:hypothetical protein
MERQGAVDMLLAPPMWEISPNTPSATPRRLVRIHCQLCRRERFLAVMRDV